MIIWKSILSFFPSSFLPSSPLLPFSPLIPPPLPPLPLPRNKIQMEESSTLPLPNSIIFFRSRPPWLSPSPPQIEGGGGEGREEGGLDYTQQQMVERVKRVLVVRLPERGEIEVEERHVLILMEVFILVSILFYSILFYSILFFSFLFFSFLLFFISLFIYWFIFPPFPSLPPPSPPPPPGLRFSPNNPRKRWHKKLYTKN